VARASIHTARAICAAGNTATVNATVLSGIGTAPAGTWVNPSSVKLFLALLWLIPGVGFLAHDLWTGHSIAMPLGAWRLPLAVPCLVLAAFNGVRWWTARSRPTTNSSLPPRRRRPRGDSNAEPDPTFQFDRPPNGPGGSES
jgi:hypothetical protein